MGWQTESVMEQKQRFIQMWLTNEYTMSGLCKSFGISRTTGYKMVQRYRAESEYIFINKSRAPLNIPHKTPFSVELRIIKFREKHPNWGARKIRVLLKRELPENQIPSETTINAIMKRYGLVKDKKKRSRSLGKQYPKFDPDYCNEIWSADYKGKFKLRNGRHCWPLTVCDSKSRKVIGIRCHYHPTYKAVKQAYREMFRVHGLPYFMHTDNGTPFANVKAPRRLTRLGYWLIDVGVIPVFSDNASPHQNGRHERMHKDLKAYCNSRIERTLAKQQVVMDQFTEEYNNVRPHEANNMMTPNDVHQQSQREYSERKTEYEYPFEHRRLKVTMNGSARWGPYHWLFIGRGATGRYLAAEHVEDTTWNVYYRNVLLGYFDENMFIKKEQYLKLTPPKM